MGMIQAQRHCRACGRPTLHARDHFSGGMGCLLTVVTAGLFLPVWGFVMLAEAFKPWRCQACGRGRMT